MLTSKVVVKYTLIHLAELAVVVVVLIVIRHFIDVPVWLIATIVALMVVRDAALFPKVWKAYDYGDNEPMKGLIGLEAVVFDGLDPVGYVRVKGELWKAEIREPGHPAKRGDRTKVVDTKGMTLIVELGDGEGQREAL